jgi:4-hydroxy-tetrahydrodipicolinate synthase
MRFEGIYTPVITPMGPDREIDEKGWSVVIEHLLGQGIHGLVLGGTTGENYALTPEERIRQFRYGNEVIAGRVPWIAGVNDIRTEVVSAFAVAAREAGASAILLAVPPYSLPNDKELAQHALAVDKACGLPVMLYNYPGRSGAEFGREFLERVSRNSNFTIHLIAREFPHLQLSCGADDQALEFFVWGARSWVCAAGNFLGPECIALYETCVLEGDFTKGRRIMKALLPVTTVLERGGKFAQCVKYGCEMEGLPAGTVRLPLRPMKKELKRQMRDAVLTARKTIMGILAEPAGPAQPAK